jgi:hypothetical protein
MNQLSLNKTNQHTINLNMTSHITISQIVIEIILIETLTIEIITIEIITTEIIKIENTMINSTDKRENLTINLKKILDFLEASLREKI